MPANRLLGKSPVTTAILVILFSAAGCDDSVVADATNQLNTPQQNDAIRNTRKAVPEHVFETGQRVIVVAENAKVESSDGKTVSDIRRGTVRRVLRTKPRKVLVMMDTFDGWIDSNALLPLRGAEPFLTREIKKSPSSSPVYYARGNYWAYLDYPHHTNAEPTRTVARRSTPS